MEAHFDGAPALRSSVAVLGKRALALIIKHEFCAEDSTDTGKAMCSECNAVEASDSGPVTLPNDGPGGHHVGCEWGAIVAEVKRLRGET
jgi:hypothetical protein